jgi:FkbM family methyltransferase
MEGLFETVNASHRNSNDSRFGFAFFARKKQSMGTMFPNDWILFDHNLIDEVVIIIGGHTGVLTRRVLARCPSVRVINSYEPVCEFHQESRARCADDVRVAYYDFALGDTDRTALISLDGERTSFSGSLFNHGTQFESIRIREASAMFENIDTHQRPTVYMNCEGTEYEIVQHLCEAGLTERLGVVLIQTHKVSSDRSPSSRLNILRQQMSSTHEPLLCLDWEWDIWIPLGSHPTER